MAEPAIPMVAQNIGPPRIDAIDPHPGIFHKDTYRWAGGAAVPQEFDMFNIPQGQIGGGYARNKDIGETTLLAEHVFPYATTINAIMVEVYSTPGLYAALLTPEYIMECIRNMTIEIFKAGQVVFGEFPIKRLPSSNGLMPKMMGGGTQYTYVSNGMVGVNDYQELPSPISFLDGETIDVKIRRNPNNAVLAAVSPGVGFYYVQVVFRCAENRPLGN